MWCPRCSAKMYWHEGRWICEVCDLVMIISITFGDTYEEAK